MTSALRGRGGVWPKWKYHRGGLYEFIHAALSQGGVQGRGRGRGSTTVRTSFMEGSLMHNSGDNIMTLFRSPILKEKNFLENFREIFPEIFLENFHEHTTKCSYFQY